MRRRLSTILACALVVGGGGRALAQDAAPPVADNIDHAVAAALVARGKVLADAGDYENAKKMFVESLERGPDAPSAGEALANLRAVNGKLGLQNLDDGRPRDTTSSPVDPYADGGSGGETPLDPYGDVGGGGTGTPQDPYGDSGSVADGSGGGASGGGVGDGPVGPADADLDADVRARRALLAWSGGYGLLAGLALAGPENDSGEIGGGAVLVGALGAGAGIGLAHLAMRRRPLEPGQVAATMSGGTWGALNLALLGDALDCAADENACATDANSFYKLSAFGGLIGIGTGAWLALRETPSEGDVALVNSMGMYGTAAGLLLGVAMDPPKGEAYSLNAFFGSSLGLGAGLFLASRVDTSRRRMLLVDLGAAGGAAVPWILLYPLIHDDGTNNDEQATGFISTLTMAGGAAALWYLTRGAPGDDAADVSDAEPPAALSALRRTSSGRWSLAAPMVRPMENPALAPPSGATTLGLDVVSGRF